MNRLPIAPEETDRAAVGLQKAVESILHTKRALHFGALEDARRFTDQANDHAQAALRQLVAGGADAGTGWGANGGGQATPLHLLDTPATRRLLDTLRLAVMDAEAVDEERGNVLPDSIALQPGESRGTGWAETLSEIALRLKIEVEGPRGGGQE